MDYNQNRQKQSVDDLIFGVIGMVSIVIMALFEASGLNILLVALLVVTIKLGWNKLNPKSKKDKSYNKTISTILGSSILLLVIIFLYVSN
ncbi:hypothetical protein [Virgibacillus necropolis]|uniref:Uncharacterized protein n=1 Tax=Virgibacillus necropolis TaxID=163877 RepID=A0A221MB97_9BACI|nr:hypothetical protein [Virgibacillus necropolis]ASN04948.1 hypothetical protein CFK40_07950 [Virgibacillus necropolis]